MIKIFFLINDFYGRQFSVASVKFRMLAFKSSCRALSEYLYLLLTNNPFYYLFWINLHLLRLDICVLEIQISTIVLNPLIATQRRANVVFITGTTFRYVQCTPYTVRTEAGKCGIYHRYYIQICTLYTVHCTDRGGQTWYNIQICIQRTECIFVQLIFAQIITLLLYSLNILTFAFNTVQCNL